MACVWLVGAQADQPEATIPKLTLRKWTQQHGLPGNEVVAICQNRSGYLFIATLDGVTRFDGQRFVPLKGGPPGEGHRMGVTAMVVIPGSDDVMVALRTGELMKFTDEGATKQVLPKDAEGRVIESLFYERGGAALWLGLAGGVALRMEADGVAQRFDSRHGLTTTERVYFAESGEGTVWLANGGLLAKYSEGALVRVPVNAGHEALRIASARSEGPWIVADEHLFKIQGGLPVRVGKVNNNAGSYFIRSMMEDAAGTLWFGTRSLGLRWRIAASNTQRLVQDMADISCILQDNHGMVWAGSNGGGLIRLKPAVLSINDRSKGLRENHSLAVCEDKTGRMWFSNRDGGVASLNDRKMPSVISRPQEWENFSAYSVVPAMGEYVWASTTHGLVLAGKNELSQRGAGARLSGSAAPKVMFAAKSGDLWVALTTGGVGRLRGEELQPFDTLHGAESTVIRVLAEDMRGVIWAGGEGGALYRLEAERFVRQRAAELADAGAIHALCFGAENELWIGTERTGLARLDQAGIMLFTERDGLFSQNITQILRDDFGTLWLGTPRGLSRIAIADLMTAHQRGGQVRPAVVGTDDGLPEATCLADYQPAAWKASDGILWFTTRQGVVAIDPLLVRASPATITARIDTVYADAAPLRRQAQIPVAAQAHTLEFHYSTLCLAVPDRVKIRYRLHGFDDDWVEANRDGFAKYVRLPPGHYRFELVATLAGANGISASDALNVEVAAAWWQALWFRTVLALVFIALLILGVRKRSHHRLQKRLEKLERDSALEHERARIARNIHDDLGAGLTRISLLTQSAQKNEGEAQLDRIYSTVSELTQSMDAIVWAVNPKNDDLESVANYIGEFALSYLSEAGLRCRVFIPDELPSHVITAQFRHHLFLGCKEAIHNIMKHAQASDVSVRLIISGPLLTITITDNGIGPAAAAARSDRSGLTNMRSRMEALGGSLLVTPASPRGTVVTLTANLTAKPLPL